MQTMKKSIFSICLIFIINSCASQCIIFRPIGVSDKPLPEFKISTNPNDSGRNEYYLNLESFSLLNSNIKKYIDNSDSIVTLSLGRFWRSDYGSYKITITTTKGNREYFMDDSKKSHVFFEEQLPIFKENNDLYIRILTLIRRL
jgi:hypothetical protein